MPCIARSLLRSHFDALRDCNPRDLFLMEQLVMFLTAIAGKTRQLDMLYIARQQDSPDSSGGAHQDLFGDWYDRMLVPTWSEDFTRFVDCATEALARADGIPADRGAAVGGGRRTKCRWRHRCWLTWSKSRPSRWSMPVVLQVVRRLVNLPRTSLVRRVAQW